MDYPPDQEIIVEQLVENYAKLERQQSYLLQNYTQLVRNFRDVVAKNRELKLELNRIKEKNARLELAMERATTMHNTSRDFVPPIYHSTPIKNVSRQDYGSSSISSSCSIGAPVDENKILPSKPAKTLMTIGYATRTAKQEMHLKDLVRRSQARIHAIKKASVIRARVANQMKTLVIQNIIDGCYFDNETYANLEEKLRSIEAFPYKQIRDETFRRLVEFGYFEKTKENQRKEFESMVRRVISQAMSENNRRRVLPHTLLRLKP